MFWIQKVIDNEKYCVCKGQWKQFYIARFDFNEGSSEIKLYMTPLEASKVLLLVLKCNDKAPSNILNKTFTFSLHQHVKITIEGGSMVLVGESYDGQKHTNYAARFPESCEFNDFDEYSNQHSNLKKK